MWVTCDAISHHQCMAQALETHSTDLKKINLKVIRSLRVIKIDGLGRYVLALFEPHTDYTTVQTNTLWKYLLGIPKTEPITITDIQLSQLMATFGKIPDKTKIKGTFGHFAACASESYKLFPRGDEELKSSSNFRGHIAKQIHMCAYLFAESKGLLDICIVAFELQVDFELQDLIVRVIDVGERYLNIAGESGRKALRIRIKEILE